MTVSWFPLHCHSHYSLLDGLSKPEDIVDRVKECGYAGSAITDHGSLSGTVQIFKAMKKAGLKSILGSEFYLSAQDSKLKDSSNRKLSHLCVLAKNKQGWQGLIQATSEANNPDNFYYKPRLTLEKLASFSNGNFICFSGHPGSDIGNVIFKDCKAAYGARTYEAALEQTYPQDELKKRLVALAGKYQDLFGKENFRLEVSLIDSKNMPAVIVIAKALRWLSQKLSIPCVACADSHYCRHEDAEDQRILLCSAFDTTLKKIQSKIDNDEDITLGGFFRSSQFHIPSIEELQELHNSEELSESLSIAEKCESYEILGQLMPPTFNCPNGMTPNEYLKKLAIDGWKKQIEPRIANGKVVNWDGKEFDVKVYQDRIRHELNVINDAGLASYFLIVQDYVSYALNQGWLCGPGRGSAAGCLLSYLINITAVDPIPPGLLFERFYNHGRNQPGRISYPDIDCDFPISKREDIYKYIQNKHGLDKVCHLTAFQTLKGREALKCVLRAHEQGDYNEWNLITKNIPQDASISDDLQEMMDETGESSIIQWALENRKDKFKDWCYIDESGEWKGPLAKYFAQAKRLEGTKKSESRHPAGVIISSQTLSDVCPMTYDQSTKETKAGLEMGDLEALGHLKFDVLGVAIFDKLMGVKQLLRTGKMS